MALRQHFQAWHHHNCAKPHAYLCGRFYWYQLWHEHRWSNTLHTLVLVFFLAGAMSGVSWQAGGIRAQVQNKETGQLPTGPGLAWPNSWAPLDTKVLPAWQVRQRFDGSSDVVVAFAVGGSPGTFERLHDFAYSLNGGSVWRKPLGGDKSSALDFDWAGPEEAGYGAGSLGWFVFRAKDEPGTKAVSTDGFMIRFGVKSSDESDFTVVSEAVTLDTVPPAWSGKIAVTGMAHGARVSWSPVAEEHFVSYTIWFSDDPAALFRHDGQIRRFGPSQNGVLFDRLTDRVDIAGDFPEGKFVFQIEARDFFGLTTVSSTVRLGEAKEAVQPSTPTSLTKARQRPQLDFLPSGTPVSRTTRALSANEVQWCVYDRWPQYADHYVLHDRGEKKLVALALLNGDGVVCVPEKKLQPNQTYNGRHVHAISLVGHESDAQALPELITFAEAPEIKTFTPLPPFAAVATIDTKGNPASTEYAFVIFSSQFDPHSTFYLGLNNTITTIPTWGTFTDWMQDRADNTIMIQNLQPATRYSLAVKARNLAKIPTALSTPLAIATYDGDLGRQYILPPPEIKNIGRCPAGARWCDPKAK